MNKPAVSVIIQSYNYRRFLGESIESVLAQSFDDWELVIVDDASSDDSQALIRQYAEAHPQKIHAVYLEQNVGITRSAHVCLSHCQADYISILSSDDVATPHRLAEGVALLDSRPEVAAFFSKVEIIDADGQPLEHEMVFNEPVTSVRKRLLSGNFLCAPSCIVRRDALERVGAWNRRIGAVEDYDLWMRLLDEHEIERVDSIWVKYRLHGDNFSLNVNEGHRFNASYETVAVALSAVERWPLERIFDLQCPPGSPAYDEEQAKVRLELARHLIELDRKFIKRPLLAIGKAYSLALEASVLAPQLEQVDEVLNDIYRFIGDSPRADGQRSILMRDWLGKSLLPATNAQPLQLRHLGAPPPPAELDAAQREAFVRRAQGWDDKPSILAAVLCLDSGDERKLAVTRDSLARQLLPCEDILVLSPLASAASESETWVEAGPANWPQALDEALRAAGADWVYMIQAGDQLADHATAVLADAIHAQPHIACFYSDEDHRVGSGYVSPILKPDLNLDMLRSYAYTGSSLAFRRETCVALGGLRAEAGAAVLQDLIFRVVEQAGLHCVGHLAERLRHTDAAFADWLSGDTLAAAYPAVVAAHLERLGIAHALEPGPLPGCNRVRYLHAQQPPVSIIIPTRDQLPMLNGLIDSLLAKTGYKNYELLIVDNDSQDPAACAYLDGIERLHDPQLRVLRYPHPFNYSAINNFAAGQARGEYLILLNNDTAVLHEDWIEALLNHAQRPEVGIVGAKLHYPDGRIQHAGVVLGLRGPADHAFLGQAMDAPGYMHRLQVDQNYTAVTAACLMIRKSVYEEVGGLDEQDFKVSYNDVDLCLKVHQAGYLTVWTPYARLMHEGNVSQNKVDTTAKEAKLKRFQGEQAAMYRKWLPLLARDPAYNRNFSLDGPGFDLDPRAIQSWQPFSEPLAPRLFCVAADLNGCGHYRVRQPFLSMQRAGLAEGVIADTHLTPANLERFAPQAMVLQRQLTDRQIEIMGGYREYSRAFKLYELDDYLPNVPLKSIHRSAMPKDVLKSLRKAVALTDRFVVSTAPLAEQFAGLHSDIRVVPNRLPVDWWGGLPAGERRVGRKPRVGWGGGNSHRGDLELIADVVRDLADEVDWVFFGMCPDKLRPYVHEFHEGVPIEQYPAKLASLNLDLALAPLEDNVFNACKSNLRLLEYGICGFPVVCSDIVCYRDGLPVTRVRNRYKDWIDAIRMHLADLDATAATGDALRDAVRRDWMLAGDNLVAWRAAWLPD